MFYRQMPVTCRLIHTVLRKTNSNHIGVQSHRHQNMDGIRILGQIKTRLPAVGKEGFAKKLRRNKLTSQRIVVHFPLNYIFKHE